MAGCLPLRGWFGYKQGRNSANNQIRQTGLENLEVLKAICLKETGREAYEMKPDKANSNQLTISSKQDINKVIAYFSSPSVLPICGDKGLQYSKFIQEASDRGIISLPGDK